MFGRRDLFLVTFLGHKLPGAAQISHPDQLLDPS